MFIKKRFGFGIGTVFSLIVVYFIYLYSTDKEWGMLAFISKWYLIIVGGIVALSLAVALLILVFSLVIFFLAMFRIRSFKKKHKEKHKGFIDADYKVKE